MTPKQATSNTSSREQARRKVDVRHRLEKLREKDKTLTFEAVSFALRYRIKSYISKMLTDNGVVSDLFLSRFNPYYADKMAAGTQDGPMGDPPYLQRFAHPFMECDFLYRMRGDSMEPKIPNGSDVGVKSMSIDSGIINSEVYLVVTKNKLVALRCVHSVQDNPDQFELTTYEREAKPTFIGKEDIEAIYKAEFVVRFL